MTTWTVCAPIAVGVHVYSPTKVVALADPRLFAPEIAVQAFPPSVTAAESGVIALPQLLLQDVMPTVIRSLVLATGSEHVAVPPAAPVDVPH